MEISSERIMEISVERPDHKLEKVNEELIGLNSEVFGLMAVGLANLEAAAAVRGIGSQAGATELDPEESDDMVIAESVLLVEHDLVNDGDDIVTEIEMIDEPYVEIKGSILQVNELSKVRDRLKELDEWQRKHLDVYCAINNPGLSGGIIKRRNEMDKPVFYSDWLTNEATDDQLLNFLQWHTYNLKNEQESEIVQEQIKKQRDQYKEDVEQGVSEGWLPESSFGAIMNVDNVPVYLGDVFDTFMEDRTGYYWKGYVVIAASSTVYNQNNISLIGKHEFNHAVLGRLPGRWLNEAATEHIASSFKNGQPDVVDPDKRESDDEIYKPERQLLAALLEGGDGEPIPARLITLAYAEQPPACKLKQTLGVELEKKWGRDVAGGCDVLDLLTWHVSKLEEENMRLGAKTRRRAEQFALMETRMDLFHRPEKIFGKELPAETA